jgi:hypothetical protein
LMFINMVSVQKVLQWFCIEMKITGNDVRVCICVCVEMDFHFQWKKVKYCARYLICASVSCSFEMNNNNNNNPLFFLKQKISILLDFRMGGRIV